MMESKTGGIMKTLFKALIFGLSLSTYSSTIDFNESLLKWKGSKVTGEHVGTIAIKSGDLKFSKGLIESGELIVDMEKIKITDLQGEWADKFLSHIKSADFFDTQKFPIAKINIKSDDGNKLNGELTIKGKTSPISFRYKKTKNTYSGVMKFDRTKFDMIYGSGDFFKNLGDKMINNDVEVEFNIKVK